MKFILDEDDNEFIESVNKDLEEGNTPPIPINQIGGKYYIEFKCLDIAKANNFVLNIASSNDDIQKEIEEKCGISVNFFSYSNPDRKIDSIKEILKRVLYELENM